MFREWQPGFRSGIPVIPDPPRAKSLASADARLVVPPKSSYLLIKWLEHLAGGAPFVNFQRVRGLLPFMKNKLRRYYGRKELHFITFSCYQRRPFLNSLRAKTVLIKILEEVRTRYQFSLVGYVLMPEHVHLLIGEPMQVTPSKAV